MVRQPAEAAGLRFEEGLVEIIVGDVMDTATHSNSAYLGDTAPSTILPLLEFALTQLWEKRQNGRLTRKAYDTIDGITGGLRQWTDRVFFGLEDEEKQRKARRIFTDLVHMGDKNQGLTDSRRRLSLDSLCRNEGEKAEVSQLVQELTNDHLLVTAYDTQSKQNMVEIIHDALIWEWGELRGWLKEDRAFLVWHQELERQTSAWVETNVEHPARRGKHKLLRGADLLEAVKYLDERRDDLSQIERDFIEASRKLRERGRFYVAAAVLVVAAYPLFRGVEWVVSQIPRYTNITTFSGHHEQVWGIAWSPDSMRIASTSGGRSDHRVLVWPATTDKATYSYSGHSQSVTSVTWSPDGYRIASGGYDQTVQVWSSDGIIKLPITYPAYTYRKHTDYILTIAWSPDGKYIASGGLDRTVQVWSADPARIGEFVSEYSEHKSAVNSVAWSPNSKYLASGSGDNTVQVWEATTGENIRTYKGHSSHVVSVAWSPNGKYVASGGFDKTVQVWSADASTPMRIYSGHTRTVTAVAWSPDGKYIASAGEDQTVQVWDALNGNVICTYEEHHSKVRRVAWSRIASERLIASAGDDKLVRVWKLKE
jgi:WD40 repeat protein